jgi:hypothetical protein
MIEHKFTPPAGAASGVGKWLRPVDADRQGGG